MQIGYLMCGVVLGEFGVQVIILHKGVQNMMVLVQGIAWVLVLMGAHLQERLSRAKELDIKTIFDGS